MLTTEGPDHQQIQLEMVFESPSLHHKSTGQQKVPSFLVSDELDEAFERGNYSKFYQENLTMVDRSLALISFSCIFLSSISFHLSISEPKTSLHNSIVLWTGFLFTLLQIVFTFHRYQLQLTLKKEQLNAT